MKKLVILSVVAVLVIGAILAFVQVRQGEESLTDSHQTAIAQVFESNEPVNDEDIDTESTSRELETKTLDSSKIDLEELQQENTESPEIPETSDDQDIDMVYLPQERNITDYDGDGVLDWVRVEADGLRYVYINKGTNDNPIFEGGILIE